ncbi:MAG: hypothetical protein ACE5G0_23090 [Rhodothermales bacterium]
MLVLRVRVFFCLGVRRTGQRPFTYEMERMVMDRWFRNMGENAMRHDIPKHEDDVDGQSGRQSDEDGPFDLSGIPQLVEKDEKAYQTANMKE